MKIKEFGDILKKIGNNPIVYNDVYDNIYLVRNEGIDLNYKEPIHNDYPHYYYEPGNSIELNKAITKHNDRVDSWNNKHPYQKVEHKVFSDIYPNLHPIIIRSITVKGNEELFQSLYSDFDVFVKTFNKTTLLLFHNKLEKTKTHEVNTDVKDGYRNIIKDINKWFIDNDIDLDKTDSFFDEKELSYKKNDKSYIPPKKELQDSIQKESNAEAIVRTKIIKNMHKTNRQLRTQVNYLKKYRSGNLTDSEIEKIVDSCRKKNGKINYTAVGKIIGLSKDTIRKLISDRKLTWLIESQN